MHSETKIPLEKLQLKTEVDSFDDVVRIYTKRGVYNPDKPLGMPCVIAELPCSDVNDPDDSAHQIANLFKTAPELLKGIQKTRELLKKVPDFDIKNYTSEDVLELNWNATKALRLVENLIAKVEGK